MSLADFLGAALVGASGYREEALKDDTLDLEKKKAEWQNQFQTGTLENQAEGTRSGERVGMANVNANVYGIDTKAGVDREGFQKDKDISKDTNQTHKDVVGTQTGSAEKIATMQDKTEREKAALAANTQYLISNLNNNSAESIAEKDRIARSAIADAELQLRSQGLRIDFAKMQSERGTTMAGILANLALGFLKQTTGDQAFYTQMAYGPGGSTAEKISQAAVAQIPSVNAFIRSFVGDETFNLGDYMGKLGIANTPVVEGKAIPSGTSSSGASTPSGGSVSITDKGMPGASAVPGPVHVGVNYGNVPHGVPEPPVAEVGKNDQARLDQVMNQLLTATGGDPLKMSQGIMEALSDASTGKGYDDPRAAAAVLRRKLNSLGLQIRNGR